MCYCPDLSSKHAGFNAFTGGSGHGLFHYLREVGSYVLPNQKQGTYVFGCHLELTDDAYVVRPWEGVGRKIVMRQIGASFSLSFGRFIELHLDRQKRWFEAEIENPSDKEIKAVLTVSGLWGRSVTVGGKTINGDGGKISIPLVLPARQRTVVKGNVPS
jgi:hypothetical protein